MRLACLVLMAALSPFATPHPGRAQDAERPLSPPRYWLGIEFHGGDGTGEFGEQVEGVWGFDLVGRWAPRPSSWWMYRVDLGLLTYGEEEFSVCAPPPVGCRIVTEVTTSNDILFAGVGPELRFVGDRLYLFGTLGLSYFTTSSSVSGASVSESLLTTEHFSDTVFAFRVGGGWRFLVRDGRHPFRIDLGAEYHYNGVAEYLLEGNIIDNPDGTLTLVTTRGRANVFTLRLGFSFGFGRELRSEG